MDYSPLLLQIEKHKFSQVAPFPDEVVDPELEGQKIGDFQGSGLSQKGRELQLQQLQALERAEQ